MTVFCFYSPQHQTTSALLSPSFCMSLSHALLSTCLSLPMGRTGCPIRPQPVLWLEGSEEATTDPPWCSTTSAFAAVPGLAEKCPQEPISRPLPHPSCPTHRWSTEGSCSCVPCYLTHTGHLVIPRYPSTGLLSTRVKMYALPNIRKKGFLVYRCPCAASDRHYVTFQSKNLHSGLRGREALVPSI